jgi:hypothetical protein
MDGEPTMARDFDAGEVPPESGPRNGSGPESFRRTDGPGYQPGSEEPAPSPTTNGGDASASPGYQPDSGEPTAFSEVPGDDSAGETTSDTPAVAESERIDPFQAFAEVRAKVAEEKRREKERRNPAIWLPGADELDSEPGMPDRETRFSRDGWGGRGNPQVGVRLRPMDFERLGHAAASYGVRPTTLARMLIIRGVNAILKADLERSAELLKDRYRATR